MSAENVEIVRRLVVALNGRDLEALFAETDEDAELYPLRAQLEGSTYRGHQGLRQLLSDFDEDWETIRLERYECRDAGDQVVLLGRLRARGRTSGIELDQPIGFVWRLRDGKAVYAKAFSEQDDALRAAGLE
jgi:ketosteroid isomerase-like protein